MFLLICLMFGNGLINGNTISSERTVEFKCPEPMKNCNDDRVEFHLYTDKRTEPHRLNVQDYNTFTQAEFKPESFIKLIFPGYDQGRNSTLMTRLKNEYLTWGLNKNIIFVDYANLADKSCYKRTILFSVAQIGKCVAKLVDTLLTLEQRKLKIDHFHAIGFGLGAHIAANASNNLQSGRFKRITGLDPENVGYLFPSVECLNKRHASFVDVFHSNSGWYGVLLPIGHIDVYFNGGTIQPRCFGCDLCSHKISIAYFIDTINPETVNIVGIKCNFLKVILDMCETGKPEDKLYVGEYVESVSTEREGVYAVQYVHTLRPWSSC